MFFSSLKNFIMTFLGAMLALLLPKSAWRVIYRRQREHGAEWERVRRPSQFLLQDQAASEVNGTDNTPLYP